MVNTIIDVIWRDWSSTAFKKAIEDILTSMKDGDKNYRAMLPCYYVEKTDEVKECA